VTQKDALDKGRAAKDSAVDEITHPMAEDLFQWQFAAARHFGFHFLGSESPFQWRRKFTGTGYLLSKIHRDTKFTGTGYLLRNKKFTGTGYLLRNRRSITLSAFIRSAPPDQLHFG